MNFFPVVILACLLVLTSACAKKENSLVSQDSSDIVSSDNSETQKSANDTLENLDDLDISDFGADDFGEDFLDDDFDDYSVAERSDPLIAWNRFWFGLNDFALLKIGKPVHQVYVKSVPKTIRTGITSLRYNLRTPVRMGNALLQFEFGQFFVEFGKLTINLMTSAGFADVASRNEALVPHTPRKLRFGHTLAKWHFPQGPYLVLPFYGPSTVRETAGTVGDVFAEPLAYFIPWQASFALASIFTVNSFEDLYTAYGNLKENAFDPYLSLRNVYLEQLDFHEPKYDYNKGSSNKNN